MENVTLEVFAVDMPKAVGFRRMEPNGPAGIRFGLYLPSSEEGLTSYSQLAELVETMIVDSPVFPWRVGFVNIHNGNYAQASSILLAQYIQDFPLAKDCRISCPAKLIYGEGL